MIVERLFVPFKTAHACCKFQAPYVCDSFATHRNQMLCGNPANGDIVDTDKVRLESGEESIDQYKRNSLLFQLFKLSWIRTARGDNQAVKPMSHQ